MIPDTTLTPQEHADAMLMEFQSPQQRAHREKSRKDREAMTKCALTQRTLAKKYRRRCRLDAINGQHVEAYYANREMKRRWADAHFFIRWAMRWGVE